MKSREGESIDAQDWDNLHYGQRRSTRQYGSRWNLVILVAVVFLHLGFIEYLFSGRAAIEQKTVSFDDALEITFIDREPTPTPELPSSDFKIKKVAQSSHRQSSARGKTDATMPADSRLETTSPTLRLTLDSDEWNSKPVLADRNPLKRQFVALPGRTEPFVQGIKFRNKLTPQQKLAMVGKLFGAVDYDPCKEARNRMANAGSQMSEFEIEWDLRAIEHHCRP